MRFNYEYRTSDNALKRDTLVAPNRDAAFAALRVRGIRPARLVEAPGFFNKLFGKGKRWLAIGVLAALCLALCVTLVRTRHETRGTVRPARPATLPRHQIAGLPSDWPQYIDSIFADDIDRLLARHSQPGVVVDAVSRRVPSPDSPWVDVLRRIVAGMREDATGYLKLGRSVRDLEAFLEERQRMESDYRARFAERVRRGELTRAEAKDVLRSMGLEEI